MAKKRQKSNADATLIWLASIKAKQGQKTKEVINEQTGT